MSGKGQNKTDAGKKKQRGPPFISDPPILIFRDFVVGESMHIPFTLTNASFARNTYKVIGFDQEYSAIFQLNCSPPGFISPGVSVNLSLDFTPKFNSMIACQIHFLAETGPFDVQVECHPKAVNIRIEPFDVFDLGVVTLGEEIEQPLVIRNSGALDAAWSLSLEPSPIEPGFLTLQEAEDGVLQFSVRHGVTHGYGQSQVRVGFRPSRPGQLRFCLRFRFSSLQNEFDPFVKDLPLEAVGSDVPVFLESDRIDLGVCYFKELYRSTLVAHNRSNLSQRFVIQIPANLDKFLEFMPKVGFIQPQSMLQITIKLRTTSKFATLFPQFEKTADIPIKMEVVNQVLPVNFSVTFTPSPVKLTFEPAVLDFGTFLTTECKQVTLKMTSQMELPSNFGFIRLPNGISVQPYEGFGLIMPGETVDMTISFQSQIPKKHEFVVQVATLQGQKFNVPCVAHVVTAPLQMSATTIEFEATPLGQDSSFKLVFNNTRQVPLDFEIETCDDFLLDPVVATIPPTGSLPVFITFRPSVPIRPEKPPEEEPPPTSAKGAKKEKGKAHGKAHTHENKKTGEPVGNAPREIISSDFTYRLYEKSFACFYRSGTITGRHHLMLKGAAVLPTLFVTSVVINKVERRCDEFIDLSLSKINFGVVCTGQTMDAVVELKSVVKKNLPLEYECELGSFEVLSPSVVVRPLQSTTVRIRFAPTANMKFTSLVHVKCPERPNIRVALKLAGEGAAPSIALSQESLDFGHVVVGHTIARSVQVKNNANFALEYVYELRPSPTMHTKNMSGAEAFEIPRKNQWLKPGETGEATVVFSPDHDDLTFQSVLIISAGEDGESREVPISAGAWPHVMFIMGGVEEPQQRTAFDHYALDEPYFRPNVTCDMAYPGPTATTVLIFGVANQNEEIKKTNGDLTFDTISTPGFTVTPPKSAVEAGGITKVTIEYAPPASSLLQVGQWVVADTAVNLKCADFARKVPVRLKCLINLQQAADLSQASGGRSSKASTKGKRRK
jgi:hypothetical protein